MEKDADKILDYPIQNKLTHQIRKEANIKNDVEFMSMWAGQGMPFCKAQSVAELMQELCDNSGN